ncbi:MAG: glycerol-3-phosphate 1-O-acyltransferase PlsY [Candidatus Margulisiibacteriota bacterium]
MPTIYFAYIFLAYLLGSIPFGVIVSKIWNIDIRRYGSGNIGATNVFRVLGIVPGAIVFILDLLKGALAVYLGYWLGGDPLLILFLGVSAIFGHMYSIFLGFKGGKGAATGLGVLLGIAPEIFLISSIFAASVIALTRYVSIGSITSAFLVVALMSLFHKPISYTIASFLVAIFVLIRHLPNLKRLLQGTEPKIGKPTL